MIREEDIYNADHSGSVLDYNPVNEQPLSTPQDILTNGWFSSDMAAGTPMEGMSNPYVNGLDWQAVMDYLNGKSQLFNKKGTRNYELYLKALEWNNNIMSQLAAWDAEKDIYSQQVKGQKEAGLNPDLTGVSGNTAGFTGPASPSGESSVAGSASDSGQQTTGFIFSVITSVVSIFNAGVGAAMKGAQLVGQKLMNQGQGVLNDIRRTQRSQSENSALLDYFANNLTEDQYKSIMNGTFDGENAGYAPSVSADDFSAYTGMDISQAERLVNNWNQRLNSPGVKESLYKSIANRYEALHDYQTYVSSPDFKDEFNANSLLQNYYELLLATDVMIKDAQQTKSRYDKIYYNALSPQLQAGFQNSKNLFDTSYYRALNPETASMAANAEKSLNIIRHQFDQKVYNLVNKIMSNPNSTSSDMTFATQLYAQLIQGRGLTLNEFATSWLGQSYKGVVDFLGTPMQNLFNGRGIEQNILPWTVE